MTARHVFVLIAISCAWNSDVVRAQEDDAFRKKFCGDIAVALKTLHPGKSALVPGGGDDIQRKITGFARPSEREKQLCASVNRRKRLDEHRRGSKDTELIDVLMTKLKRHKDEQTSLQTLETLLHDGASPDVIGTSMYLVQFLPKYGDVHTGAARRLLEYTARGQLHDRFDVLFGPLVKAIQLKDEVSDDFVKLLVNAMWSNELATHVTSKGKWTATMWASRKGRAEVISALIGGNEAYTPENVDYVGTALHLAAKEGSVESVKVLLAQPNVTPNVKAEKSEVTPLHFACLEDHLNVVKYLLAHEADPCSKDALGKTPRDKVITNALNAAAILDALGEC